MNDRQRLNRWNEKEDLIDEIKTVMGVEPQGIRQLLGVLSHPDIIEHTINFFRSHDPKNKCRVYEDPWNCIREAEAKYESITYGWVGAEGNSAVPEYWCEPCRQRVLGEI